jgi:hypothetical protein
MKLKPSNNQKSLSQPERFKEAARELDAGESNAAFDEKLVAVARQTPRKPTITTYQALISMGDPDGVHKRLSVEAADLVDAKAKLETEFGVGSVVSLWGDWESQQARNTIGKQK